MDAYIQQFVENITPTDSEIRHGMDTMDKLFRWFHNSNVYSIDRARLAGSTQKNTSISGFVDFDCVIFINPKCKDSTKFVIISDVVDNLEDILLMESDLERHDIKKSPRENPTTLMFSLKNVSFDVSVAINEADPYCRQSGNLISDQQRIGYYANSRNTNLDRRSKSVYLVETNIEFANTETAFAHEVARLAKFWNKTLQLELLTDRSYVSGRSSIMELVAFSAAEEEEQEKSGNSSYRSAFERFLKKMKWINYVKLSHDHYWEDQSMEWKKPLVASYVLEPSDPTNNLLKNMNAEIIKHFMNHADRTLNKLRSNDTAKLFDLYPKWHRNEPKPKNILISTIKATNPFPLVKYNKTSANKKNVTLLKKYLVPIVNREKIGKTRIEEIKDGINRCVSEDILNISYSNCPSFDKHEDRQVTMTIPFNNTQEDAYVISFDT